MTCKDCIHYCLCKDTLADENWGKDTPQKIKDMYSPKGCENFKNKADFIEVVRCKDCIYYNSNCCFNRQWDFESSTEVPLVRENDFCSYGERKESEVTEE